MATALSAPRDKVTAEQLALAKRTVAQGATDDEFALYVHDCQRQGVHPLDKLLHFTKRGGKYTPITSIDFMRMRAADTGEYAGSEDATFITEQLRAEGKTISESYPVEAHVTVWRLVQGQRCAFSATARWSEYYPGDAQGHMWRRMPHTMLAKCAEALALRKGFPRQLAGLYAREELDQADRADVPSPLEAPRLVDEPYATVETPPSPTAADLPPGAVRILRIDTARLKNKNLTQFRVTLSTGDVVTTVNPRLAAVAEAVCQGQEPVRVQTERKGQYHNLIEIKRLETNDQQPELTELTDDEIPF